MESKMRGEEKKRKPRRVGSPAIYAVDKKHEFVVSSQYRDHSGKPMHELLLNLLKKDSNNH